MKKNAVQYMVHAMVFENMKESVSMFMVSLMGNVQNKLIHGEKK